LEWGCGAKGIWGKHFWDFEGGQRDLGGVFSFLKDWWEGGEGVLFFSRVDGFES
jgi:hypothetical protein